MTRNLNVSVCLDPHSPDLVRELGVCSHVHAEVRLLCACVIMKIFVQMKRCKMQYLQGYTYVQMS